MKLKNIEQIHEFLRVVNTCTGGVYLTSQDGDKYNLKSKLSQYIAVGALLGEHGDDLELWCDHKDDEVKFIGFLKNHPEIL